MTYFGVKTLLHEASHKYLGTNDYVYFADDGVTPLGVFNDFKRAVTNADSWGWFIVMAGWIEAYHYQGAVPRYY